MNPTITREQCQQLFETLYNDLLNIGVPLLEDTDRTLRFKKVAYYNGYTEWRLHNNGDKTNCVITLSTYLLYAPIDEIKSVICHELCHCTDSSGHDKKWKYYTKMVRERLGIEINQCYPQSYEVLISKLTNCYVLECTKCHSIITRHRKSDSVLHPEKYGCPYCNSSCCLKLVRSKT